MTDDVIEIGSGALRAGIAPLGAELQWLRDEAGRDLLWDGDPAFWTGRAPILFPVVGAVANDTIHVDGRAYPMAKHGFARRRRFDLIEHGESRAVFRLVADEATRAAYPFDFVLDVAFAIEGATLSMTATVHNPGDRPLPTSFGFHPALRWPLPYGAARDAYAIRFDQAEPAPARRIGSDGLLRAESVPSPIDGDLLRLDDALFVDDALILDRPVSRGCHYGAPGVTGLRIDWPDMPMLGLWTKPGAGYVCVEPWAGIADPHGYTGEFADKPGVEQIAPGAVRDFTMRIAIERAAFVPEWPPSPT